MTIDETADDDQQDRPGANSDPVADNDTPEIAPGGDEPERHHPVQPDGAGALVEGARVRVYPDTTGEVTGVVVDDFADSAGHAVLIGDQHIARPARRWAIALDNGGLVFVDGADLALE